MNRSSFVAILLLVWGTVAYPTFISAADGPPLGTWSTVTRLGRQEFPGRLTLLRRTGSYYDVFVDSTIPGGPKWASVATMRFDTTSHAVRIEQRETHTTADRSQMEGGTLVLTGTYNSQTKTMSNVVVPWDPESPVLSATFVSSVTAISQESLTKASEATNERQHLYQQLSADFEMNGERNLGGVDCLLRKKLVSSTDPFVREWAGVALEIGVTTVAMKGKHRQEIIEHVNGIPKSIYKSVFGVLADTAVGQSPPTPLHLLVNSRFVQDRFARDTAEAKNLILSAAICEQFASQLRGDRANERAVQSRLIRLTAGFTIDDQDCVVLSLRNGSGKALHNCVGFSRVRVNQSAMDEYEREYRDGELPQAILFEMAGFELSKALEADEAAMAFHRLDKNVPLFVREWPAAATVKFRMARGDALKAVGKSADFWIVSDEGGTSIDLPIDSMKRRVVSKRPRF